MAHIEVNAPAKEFVMVRSFPTQKMIYSGVNPGAGALSWSTGITGSYAGLTLPDVLALSVYLSLLAISWLASFDSFGWSLPSPLISGIISSSFSSDGGGAMLLIVVSKLDGLYPGVFGS